MKALISAGKKKKKKSIELNHRDADNDGDGLRLLFPLGKRSIPLKEAHCGGTSIVPTQAYSAWNGIRVFVCWPLGELREVCHPWRWVSPTHPPTPQLNIIIPPEWKCFRDTWASRGWQSYFEGGVLLFTWLAMRDKRAPADMYSASDTETCQTDWGWMEGEPGSCRGESVRTVSVQNLLSISRWFWNGLSSSWSRRGGAWGMCEIQNTFQTRSFLNREQLQRSWVKEGNQFLTLSWNYTFSQGCGGGHNFLAGGPQPQWVLRFDRVGWSRSRWMEYYGAPPHRRKKIYLGIWRKHVL